MICVSNYWRLEYRLHRRLPAGSAVHNTLAPVLTSLPMWNVTVFANEVLQCRCGQHRLAGSGPVNGGHLKITGEFPRRRARQRVETMGRPQPGNGKAAAQWQ